MVRFALTALTSLAVAQAQFLQSDFTTSFVSGSSPGSTSSVSTTCDSKSCGAVVSISGVVPGLAGMADTAPVVEEGLPKRSECGIGALMPWADKLYMVTYLSVPGYGSGTGLYEIDEHLHMKKLANHSSVYANRMIHHWTDQVIIGPYAINSNGHVRTFEDFLSVRIGAVAEHILEPELMIYVISMEGVLYEANVNTLAVTKLVDLVDTLGIPVSPDPHTTGQCYPHFKAALTVHASTDGKGGIGSKDGGTLYVASNGFNEADFLNGSSCGRFASWDGKGDWKVLEHTAFYEVVGRKNYGRAVYATGWDRKSAILKVLQVGSPDSPDTGDLGWQTVRLPKASHAFDHGWQTEWPRIREVETERYLLDTMGMFYELSPLGWGGTTFGVRPISQHLRVVPDFASYRGLLVMGGNQVSSIFDNNIITGQSQSGLWLGKTDDLWSWGKPQGWGSVWLDESVAAGSVSDPYLMTGFDHKTMHISAESNTTEKLTFSVEVDPTGDAMRTGKWRRLASVQVAYPDWFTAYVFPTGFSAHWVRVRADAKHDAMDVTAHFTYT